jgi:hypothetical protein
VIFNNRFNDFKPNNDAKAVGGYIIITDSYSSVVNNAKGIKRIYISNNEFNRNGNASTIASLAPQRNFLGAFIAIPGSMHQEIHFEKNKFSQKSEEVRFIKTQ